MILMILGLLLWTALHFFRVYAPEARARMTERMGEASKGPFALGILAALLMMIFGYRAALFTPVWYPPEAFTLLNNALVLLAFYIYLTTATKPGTAWVFGNLRNPQLVGFSIWAVAHLLVNGDLASIVLFGGLLLWALGEIAFSRPDDSLVDRSKAKITSPVVHAGVVLGVYIAVALIHAWVGPMPLGV